MGFFTARFSLKDAFWVCLVPMIFLWFSVIAAITNYANVTTALGLARTQQMQLKTCMEYAEYNDGWWIARWTISLLLTPIGARIYYVNIKPTL